MKAKLAAGALLICVTSQVTYTEALVIDVMTPAATKK